jgi:hypothetical protein
MLQKHERQLAAVTIQDVQRVTGRLMSMMLTYAGMRVFTRSLYRIIAVAVEGNDRRSSEGRPRCYSVQLTVDAIEECRFWLERLRSHNGLAINAKESQVQMTLWTDASDVGWGGEVAGVEAGPPSTDVQQMAHGL